MLERKLAATAGIDDHIAIAQNILDEADIEHNILHGGEWAAAAALRPKRALVDVDNILPVQDVLIVLVLLANPEDPPGAEQRDRQPDQKHKAGREQPQA